MKTVYVFALILLVLVALFSASGYEIPVAPPTYNPPTVTGAPCGYYDGYSYFCSSPMKCTVDYTGNAGEQRGTCQDSSYFTKSGVPIPTWFRLPE